MLCPICFEGWKKVRSKFKDHKWECPEGHRFDTYYRVEFDDPKKTREFNPKYRVGEPICQTPGR